MFVIIVILAPLYADIIAAICFFTQISVSLGILLLTIDMPFSSMLYTRSAGYECLLKRLLIDQGKLLHPFY